MSEIREVLNNRINEFTLIFCTKNEDSYVDANIVKIIDNGGAEFETSDFKFEQFTKCFLPDDSEGTICVATKASIPEKFLIRGNKVELIHG